MKPLCLLRLLNHFQKKRMNRQAQQRREQEYAARFQPNNNNAARSTEMLQGDFRLRKLGFKKQIEAFMIGTEGNVRQELLLRLLSSRTPISFSAFAWGKSPHPLVL